MFNDKILKSVAEAVKAVMDEALKGDQHKIDKNKNGKVDAHDFKLLRKEEAPKKPASPFDWKNTPRQTAEKGEKTGHDSKKISTGTVYTKRYTKEEASQAEFNAEIKKAQDKSTGKVKADVAKPAVQAVKQESVEQIDELSKNTLKSYSTKAKKDSEEYKKAGYSYDSDPDERAFAPWAFKKAASRAAGAAKADSKIKEEVEQVDEDKYDRMLSNMIKRNPGVLKTHSKEVKRTNDIESGKELGRQIKKNPGVLKTYSAAVKRDKKMYGEEADSKIKEDVTESSGQILSKGTTVTVTHKGKQVKGKIVRYDAGKGGYSSAYVVDIGKYESIMVPVSKIKQAMNETLEEGRPSQSHPLEGHDYHKKTDAELKYIAKDAHEAAEAMKSHNTTAENKYRDQANDSATVRYWRQKNGTPDWYKKKYGHIKEDVEHIEERSLSTGEKAAMEKNVKGMKKNLAGFKERYGKDAKSVMYATATKQAKGE